jgi:hypothetical protein
MRQRQYEAVSEVIGSILLISLVVLAVAIVGAGFLSQPPPVQTQDLNVLAGYDENNETLYLQHDGGDLMLPGEYFIRIDGGPPIYRGEWGIGGSLTFPEVFEEPQRIQIISTRGGQQNLIREISIGQVTGGGAPIRPGPAPIPGPGGQCTQEELENYLNITYISKFSEELNNDAIYFIRDSLEVQSQNKLSGFVNYTVTSLNSYFIVARDNDKNQRRVSLSVDDRVAIHFNHDDDNQASADIFSVGNKGWSFGGKQTRVYINDVIVKTLTGNHEQYVKDSYILSFTDYQSSLTFQAGENNEFYTRLIIKNQTIVDDWDTSSYTFINVKPAEPTLLVLHLPSNQNDQVKFIGQADIVQRDGVTIYENGELLITP